MSLKTLENIWFELQLDRPMMKGDRSYDAAPSDLKATSASVPFPTPTRQNRVRTALELRRPYKTVRYPECEYARPSRCQYTRAGLNPAIFSHDLNFSFILFDIKQNKFYRLFKDET